MTTPPEPVWRPTGDAEPASSECTIVATASTEPAGVNIDELPQAARTPVARRSLPSHDGGSAFPVPHPRALRWALLFVFPYLIFGVVWAVTNPPGAAPDEHDHLIKAIASGRLDIGVPFSGQFGTDPASIRNASIARTVMIPAKLAPDGARNGGTGFFCFAFHPEKTADCLPTQATGGDELVARTATVGAYPVFLYIPMGLATRFAETPTEAFHLARLISLLMSMGLMFLAVWHLTRWLGRGAAVGLAIGVTPMAVFAASSVSTSGVEIMAAAAVAAVVVVSTRSPWTLAQPATLAVLSISASALVLSRQLGVVTLGLLVVIGLLRGGARVVWEQLRLRRWPMIATVLVVGLSTAAVATWELRYDHPALTGPVLSARAFGTVAATFPHYVVSGIGEFGWLDTALPSAAIGMWVLVAVTVCGAAAVVGRRSDLLTVLGAFAAVVVVTYVTFATVFALIGANLQGRHLLPIFIVIPTLAGVVVAEHLGGLNPPRLARRQAVLVGVVMASLQLLSVLVNGRRYAVGVNGPIWFLADPRWSPAGGWWPWCIAALAAAVWLGYVIIRGGGAMVALSNAAEAGDVHPEADRAAGRMVRRD